VEAGKRLSIVNEDTIFHNLFPHEIQPVHVWIDSDQRYVAMTRGISTNDTTLNHLLDGNSISFDDEIELLDIDPNDALSWPTFIKDEAERIQYSFLFRGVDFGKG